MVGILVGSTVGATSVFGGSGVLVAAGEVGDSIGGTVEVEGGATCPSVSQLFKSGTRGEAEAMATARVLRKERLDSVPVRWDESIAHRATI